MENSTLKQKTFAFACKIVRLVQKLQSEKKEFVLSNQLMDCGTSVGANYHEAEFAESKSDFIHKLGISLKEANESSFFLRILKETEYIVTEEFIPLFSDCNEIKSMLIASIRTAKANRRNEKK